MIRFIHSADYHFGIENYGKIDSATGIHSRLLDFNNALSHCISYAIKEKIDFFLFCGDAYKTINPSPTQQKLLLKSFLQLYKANIPVVIIVGNHDNPLSFGKANSLDIFKELPFDGFHVLSKPDTIRLELKKGPIQIVGIPWPARNTIAINKQHLAKSSKQLIGYITNALSSIIKEKASQLDPNIPSVLAGHLTVSNGIFSGSEKRAIYGSDPCLLPSQLSIAPFDYVALGHLHRYQNLNPKGYPAIVYSGSIERIDFGERKEEKGFCVVSIPEKNKATHEFIKIPIRAFKQIEIHLKTEADQTEQIIEVLKENSIENAIIKIRYHIPAGKKDLVDIKRIQSYCSNVHYLAGIIPIRKLEERQYRPSMKIDMNLNTLLDIYFDAKKECKERKEHLIKKTLALYEEATEN